MSGSCLLLQWAQWAETSHVQTILAFSLLVLGPAKLPQPVRNS